MLRLIAVFTLAVVMLGLARGDAAVVAYGSAEDVLVTVGPGGTYASLNDALMSAPDGAVIEVRGGAHRGPFAIERSVTLVGVDWPVLDGGGAGSVVSISAPDVVLRGFVVRGSGRSLDQENSGVVVEATNVVVQGNRLEETLFGIYLKRASGSVIRGNEIEGIALDLPRRGDAIRVWYSDEVTIERNTVRNGRDVVLWYSKGLKVRENEVSGGRYGLHFMYCDDALIERNLLAGNSVGAFLMYSRRLHMDHNVVAHNRGPSGYGVGLKDLDDAVIKENLFVDNRVGAHVDNSPREIDSTLQFTGNVFAQNDAGVQLMPSVKRNQFTGNGFIDNIEQVAVAGGGTLQQNSWTVDGTGNYWSDYAGYDADGDKHGDIPYKAERLFESLMDRHPGLRLFIYSPAAQAVDFAARAVPFIKPTPKLTDEAPLMAPVIPQGLPIVERPSSALLAVASVGLLAAAALALQLGRVSTGRRVKVRRGDALPKEEDMAGGIIVRGLTKRFGDVRAVDGLSFALAAGESLALWGPNGSGKTTTLRCLLGLMPYEGSVEVSGREVRRDGKQVRRLIGFVPQELAFHDDLTVEETMRFYARLKKVDAAVIPGLLERLGLAEQASKQVRHLSGGTKQRLALALALLADPPVLILDEPTASLDARARSAFLVLLQELKAAGKTLVFASHRIGDVLQLADRVLVLEGGRLERDCRPDEMDDRADSRLTIKLRVSEEYIPRALDALVGQGVAASRNGLGVRVHVQSDAKGEPFWLLGQAGVPVPDFDIESGDHGEE
jgi:nitrous oxidase accessory protein